MTSNTAFNLEARKLQIIQAVLSAKEGVLLDNLERLASLIGTKKEEELVDIEGLGFWLDGQPVTAASFYKRVALNEADKKDGKYKSHEAFEKESQTW